MCIRDRAGRSAVSGRTLSRLVRAETGMSFGRWRQRIQVALSILRLAQGATVQAVALELGYESAGSFVTMFRKVIGTSPVSYTHLDVYKRQARGGPRGVHDADLRKPIEIQGKAATMTSPTSSAAM